MKIFIDSFLKVFIKFFHGLSEKEFLSRIGELFGGIFLVFLLGLVFIFFLIGLQLIVKYTKKFFD